MSGNDSFSRFYSCSRQELRDLVLLYVDKVLDTRDRTAPELGTSSEEGKDVASVSALRDVGRIVNMLAGWAIDHQIGLAVDGIRSVPLGPVKDAELARNARERVDSHRFEIDGRHRQMLAASPLSVSEKRRLLAELVRLNPGDLPLGLGYELSQALEALEFGEVLPILAPLKEGRKVGLRTLLIQLQAITFVQYRRAKGLKAGVAEAEVADAFGVSPETVRTWEKRARDELGRLKVGQEIARAKSAAINSTDYAKRQRNGQLLLHEFDSADEQYGNDALAEAACRFKAIAREIGS